MAQKNILHIKREKAKYKRFLLKIKNEDLTNRRFKHYSKTSEEF